MLLQFENVTRRFGGLTAVKEVSFALQSDQILGLIGPNGSGKTTCFNLITGVHHPSSGAIRFDGELIGGLPSHQIARKGVARTFQISSVFPALTAINNVLTAHYSQLKAGLLRGLVGFGAADQEEKEALEHSAQLLEFVGLGDKKEALASSLTSADQRRLMVAIALSTKPKLLMLDEPCAGMMQEEQEDMIDLIRNVCKDGVPILLVEHHMKMIMKVCHRVVVLDRGEKIAEGCPEEIQQNPAVIEAYLGRSESKRAES